MKTNMEEIDALIKETLTQEESKFYDQLDEQNIWQMIFGIFQGKNAWVNILISIIQVVWFGLFIYCAIQFFGTNSTNELIKWGIIGNISIMASALLKLYTWMQMDKKAVMREMKRLELQLASLADKLK